jgi:hypothetical protein
MAKYLLFVLSGPTNGEGDEDAYNRWYDEVHLPDLKAIPSVKTARRYKIVQMISRRCSRKWKSPSNGFPQLTTAPAPPISWRCRFPATPDRT